MLGVGVESLGAALCLSHLPPHSTDTQGNDRKVGEYILVGGGKIREPGSSELMGNNDSFSDGKQCGTVAGKLELFCFSISFKKQFAVQVKMGHTVP